MSTGSGGIWYTVKLGDKLSTIADHFYSTQALWPEIYAANKQTVGSNPDYITPGQQLFIPSNPQDARVYLAAQNCTVTASDLNIYDRPTDKSTVVNHYPKGTVLNFIEVITSESVGGNPYWGRSTQGHYYSLSGTNRPQG